MVNLRSLVVSLSVPRCCCWGSVGVVSVVGVGGFTERQHRSLSTTTRATRATTTMTTKTTTPAVTTPAVTTPRSFYRRRLPDSCKAFSSKEGRHIFASAMRHNGLKSFFRLLEQHSTQTEPAYCGISSLVICLNALAVDPRQNWNQSPWRWYEESMLNCCVDLETVKKKGITLQLFQCLALCQGLVTDLCYADDDVKNSQTTPLDQFRAKVQAVCVDDTNNNDDDSTFDRVLVVSYSRNVLGQTGSGHFSPIAAYDSASDMVLILDTARFKYAPHWVSLQTLYEAMLPLDPDTGRSRGYVTLIHERARPNNDHDDTGDQQQQQPNLPIPLLLRSELKQSAARREFKQYMQKQTKALTWGAVCNFWSEEHGRRIWDMTQPQLRPYDNDQSANETIQEVRSLIQQLLASERTTTLSTATTTDSANCGGQYVDYCRPNLCRTVQLNSDEATYVVYLAALEPSHRHSIVGGGTGRARWQLLAEAELIRYSIDTSDEIDESYGS